MKTNTSTKIERISIGRINGYRMYSKSSSVQVISDIGCNVNSLILNNQEVIDGNTDEKKLSSNYLAKSALLIPFPNRIEKGRYAYNGKVYQLDKNKKDEGHAIHGLIYDKIFKLVNTQITKSSVSASFFYKIGSTQHEGYPFNLLLLVTYTLENNQFAVSVSATNNGLSSVPYGVGWHPYLTLGKKIDGCSLNIPSAHMLDLSKEKLMIPTGRVVRTKNTPLNSNLGSKIYDTCFTKLNKFETTFGNITLFQDKNMNYLQIYTPEDRKSIAIEPMSCAPNAFNNKMGLILLAPLTSITHSFGIRHEFRTSRHSGK